MKKCLLIYNPNSGDGLSVEYAEKAKKRLIDANIWKEMEIEMHETKDSDDAYEYTKKSTKQKIPWIIVIGGDGTINQVAGGIIDGGNHSKLAIIPIGTVNNMAHALNIPIDFDASMDIIEAKHTRKIDIAKVNDNFMISSMTIGLFADAAVEVTAERKRKFGPLAYVIDFVKVYKKYKRYPVIIKHDKETMTSKITMLLVTMSNSLGGVASFTPNAEVDDGFMHVLTLSKIKILKLMKYAPKLLNGDFSDIPEIEYFETSKMTIEQPKGVKNEIQTRIDGDPSSYVPIKMEVLKRSLTIAAPKKE